MNEALIIALGTPSVLPGGNPFRQLNMAGCLPCHDSSSLNCMQCYQEVWVYLPYLRHKAT